MGTEIETMKEHEAFELFHQMRKKFGWMGCIFMEEDIRTRLEDDFFDDETDAFDEEGFEKMVEKVKSTDAWTRGITVAMVQAGFDSFDEAIIEAEKK